MVQPNVLTLQQLESGLRVTDLHGESRWSLPEGMVEISSSGTCSAARIDETLNLLRLKVCLARCGRSYTVRYVSEVSDPGKVQIQFESPIAEYSSSQTVMVDLSPAAPVDKTENPPEDIRARKLLVDSFVATLAKSQVRTQ